MDVTNIKLCEVVSVEDENNCDRIKVYIHGTDRGKNDDEIDYAYPLLPKLLHVKPKVGETVIVLLTQGGNASSNRYYIGPVISQMQDMNFSTHQGRSMSMFPGGPTLRKAYNMKGSFAEDDEIAIYGRKNTDVILSDNEVKIRCGARHMDNSVDSGFIFNRANPAYIDMKYNEIDRPVKDKYTGKETSYNSSATIVADKINIISNNDMPRYNVTQKTVDNGDMITKDDLDSIISKAHALPYGDVLVEFLKTFLEMFKRHAHPYPGESTILPQDDPRSKDFFNQDFDSMLSDNIKIS